MNDITAISVLEELKTKATCRQERVAIEQGIKAIKKASPEYRNNKDTEYSDNPYQE